MKKLISIVLALALIASLAPSLVFATEAEPQTGNSITLFNFGDTATFSATDYSKKAAAPSAFCYDGKESSLRWEMDITSSAEGLVSNTPELDMKYSEVDLSAYSDAATINVRFYSENAGSKFNLVYFGSEGIGWKDTDGDGKSDMLVSYNEAIEINGGWQVHSMPLSTLLGRFRNYAEDKLITVRFNDDGWDNLSKNGYNDGDTVYIDQIWVENFAQSEASYNDLASQAGNKLVWTAADGVSVKASETEASVKYSSDNDRGLYTSIVSKETQAIYLSTDNCVDSDGTEAYTSLFDCSDSSEYKYLNAWIYSESAQDSGIVFSLETKPASNAYVDGTLVTSASAATTRYAIPQVDWTGWKLVSLSLADDIDSSTKSNKGKVLKLRIDVNKWKGQKLTNLLGSDSNGDGTNDIAFGIDGVWVSETSAQAAYEETLAYGNSAALNANVIFAKDFNTKSSLIRKSNSYHVTNDLNADYNPYNSRLYDMSARISFDSVEYNDILNLSDRVDASKMASLQILDRKSAGSTMLAVTSNSYLNAWVYNPEPKYTFDGVTPAEFVIVLGHRGENGTAASVSYSYVAVRADWSGWKLISIPISTWGTNFATNGIAQIYISCNMDRYSRETDGNPKIVKRTDSNGYIRLLSGGGHNVFARQYTLAYTDGIISGATSSNAVTNANLHNYIDVERVWITDGPVTSEVNVAPTDNSAAFCPEAQTGNISLFTDSSSIAKIDVNTVKSTADGASVASASLENGTLTLADGLDYGTNYSVCAEIIGTNGVKTIKEFTFSTENYHVKNTQTANGISVEMYGNVPEDYAEGIMVAAVYEDNTMVNCTPVPVENNKVSVQIDDFDSATQTIKFIFINGWSEIKPLKAEIIG